MKTPRKINSRIRKRVVSKISTSTAFEELRKKRRKQKKKKNAGI